MGCLSSRQGKISEENQTLTMFEESLEFRTVEITDLEVSLTRLMKSSIPPLQGITRLVDNLCLVIPKAFIDSLEGQFEKMGESSYRNLCVFMILIGMGSETKKIEAIWYLFDVDLEDALSQDRAKEMIECLLMVSYKFTLAPAMKLASDPDKIRKWGLANDNKLSAVAKKLISQLMIDKESLAKDEFGQFVGTKKLLKLHDVRTFIDNDSTIPNRFADSFRNLKVTSLRQQSLNNS